MDCCFKHPQKSRVGTCKYCGKDYCSDCLLLHGALDSLVCEDCYSVFKKKYQSSMRRRILLIILSVILISLFLLAKLPVYWLLAFIFCIAYNLIRISQLRTAVQTKPFILPSSPGDTKSS